VRRLLPLLLAALVVAAAALTANLLVLGQAGGAGDPVGTLSPVQPALTTHAPPRPSGHHDDHDDGDDD